MTSNPQTLSLGDIEQRAKHYRGARDLLASRVQQLTDAMEHLRRDAEPLIRSALQTAKAAELELQQGITFAPQHFKKPKTYIFHGIKVGYEKGKGKLTIDDPDKTVSLIRKLYDKEQQELLIKVTEKPVKKAVAQLEAKDLKRIGVNLSDAGEQVVIRPVDSELEKALDALMKTNVHQAQGEDDNDD